MSSSISFFISDAWAKLTQRWIKQKSLQQKSFFELERYVIHALNTNFQQGLSRLLAERHMDESWVEEIRKQFFENLHKYEIITQDGYEAALTIYLRDSVYVFDIRRGSAITGELGTEIVGTSVKLREEIEERLGKDVQIIFISSVGASDYITERLERVSEAIAISAKTAPLAQIADMVFKNWLADQKPEYALEQLYKAEENAEQLLASLPPEEKNVLLELIYRGETRDDIAQQMERDRTWVNDIWEAAIGELNKKPLGLRGRLAASKKREDQHNS